MNVMCGIRRAGFARVMRDVYVALSGLDVLRAAIPGRCPGLYYFAPSGCPFYED